MCSAAAQKVRTAQATCSYAEQSCSQQIEDQQHIKHALSMCPFHRLIAHKTHDRACIAAPPSVRVRQPSGSIWFICMCRATGCDLVQRRATVHRTAKRSSRSQCCWRSDVRAAHARLRTQRHSAIKLRPSLADSVDAIDI